jgi:hypothetical protein
MVILEQLLHTGNCICGLSNAASSTPKNSNMGKPVDWLISINLNGRHFEPQPIRGGLANEFR